MQITSIDKEREKSIHKTAIVEKQLNLFSLN